MNQDDSIAQIGRSDLPGHEQCAAKRRLARAAVLPDHSADGEGRTEKFDERLSRLSRFDAEGEERAIANLAGPSIIPTSRTLIEAAFIAQAEMNGFPRLPGRIPEVDFLKTGNERTLSVDRWSGFAPTTPGKTPLAGLRRLKAPLNWAPVWRLPKCVVSTDSVIRFNSHGDVPIPVEIRGAGVAG